MLGAEPRLAREKAETLTTVLSLQPFTHSDSSITASSRRLQPEELDPKTEEEHSVSELGGYVISLTPLGTAHGLRETCSSPAGD